MTNRADGRADDELRPVRFTRGFQAHPAGSVVVEFGGTKVLSDEIVVRITAEPGHSFLDRMIALVEGANRQKTPNEIALTMLLAAMTLTFLIVCATLIRYL